MKVMQSIANALTGTTPSVSEPILDDEFAFAAMGRKIEAETQLMEIEHRIKKESQAVVEQYVVVQTDLKAEIAAADADLERYANAHKAEWGDKKSKKVGAGKVGFRTSKVLGLLDGWDWSKVAAKCKTLFPMYVTDKVEINLNKNALKGLDPKDLKKLGCELKEEDTFFASVN
jgi:phage host-nuclease inhibitor protein Gam